MAKQVLPTNFQDDVLNASMNGKRRYMLLQQDDGSYILNDVTNYDTEGSTFGAAQINATNKAVNDSVDKDDVLNTSEEVEANTDEKKVTGALVTKQLISNLGGCQITTEGSGEDTKYFIQSGADTASKKELGVEPSTLRLSLYGRAYSYIPTYGKNIRVTRWKDSGNGTSGALFYGTDSIGGEVGDALTHLDPSADNDDFTIECEAFKYIAFESKRAPSGNFNIQIDYI